jgi:aminopeptidase-like protein
MVDFESERARLNLLFDELFPITRSITGPGLRQTLDRLGEELPLEVEGVPSGTEVFDWEVPPEWHINEAYLEGPDGERYADYDETNLAVVNYSMPVDRTISREQLDDHLYTHPGLPEAIPYVTSYYDRTWGFCLPHSVYERLPEGQYTAYIDAEFRDGELNFGHTTLPGTADREFLLSTYTCHPSLANNELSGPLVLTSLYRRLAEWDERRYTYRFVFTPETIGSLSYLWRYGQELCDRLAGGLVLTCLGGPRETLTYKTSRKESARLDAVARHCGATGGADIDIEPFTPTQGSDERQYCSPGFDLPVGRFSRTTDYVEYHTSSDTKAFMGIDTLVDSAAQIESVLKAFEYSGYFVNQQPYGEPMLSKRDLYTAINSPETWSDAGESDGQSREFIEQVLAVLNYADGKHTMVEIAEEIGVGIDTLQPLLDRLQEEGLLDYSEDPTSIPPPTARD